MPKRFTASTLFVAALASAWPAGAISVHPDPMPFIALRGRGPGEHTEGGVDVVGIEMGIPAGGSVAFGSISADDVVLLLQVSITEESSGLARLVLAVFRPGILDHVPVTGAGVLAGPHHDVEADPIGSAVTLGFPTDLLGGDPISDVFFIAFADLEVGDQIALGAETPGFPPGDALLLPGGAVVPEPGTAALLGLGLAALGRARRRGRSARR